MILGENPGKLREFVPDPVRQRKAREYARLLRRSSLIELGLGVISLLILLLTHASNALALNNNPHAFVALMTKLTAQNLTEAEPSRWTKLLFYDHPTYNERMKLAQDHVSRSQRSEAT